ncbi:type II secretion system F family protein [Liquorilactobacillus mali]|nr:type II secretion system F family protein [Liquorilactobacillus mali]MDN7146538.1 type II secretion system F family protein [Liquorilactobacillus mali]
MRNLRNVYRKKRLQRIFLKSLRKDDKINWSIKQQTLFFKTLGDLIYSGFSLKQSLNDIMIFFPKQSKICRIIQEKIEMGNTFCSGLEGLVNQDTYNQLFIAERFGFLSRSLKQIGSLREKREEQRRKLVGVLLYPVMLLIMLGGLSIAMHFLWQPQMADLGIKATSTNRYNIWGLLGLSVTFVGICHETRRYSKLPILKQRQKLCKLPVIGSLFREYYAYYITFNLAILLKEGMNIKEVYFFLKNFKENTFLYEIGRELGNNLESGNDIHELIAKYDFFPSEISLFLQKGKMLSLVGEELFFFSEMIYKRLTLQINRLIEMVQPILFIIIAIIIVVTYLRMLTPIYSNLGGA